MRVRGAAGIVITEKPMTHDERTRLANLETRVAALEVTVGLLASVINEIRDGKQS